MAEKASNIRQNRESEIRQRQGAKKSGARLQGGSALNLQQAVTNPGSANPGAILELQHIAGNQAVSRLIQAKLTVGAADDAYEREADQMANTVLSMPEPGHPGQAADGGSPVQRQDAEDEELLQGKPLAASISRFVQREAEEEEELQMKPALQRQEEEDELQTKPVLQRQEEEEELQMKPALQRQEEEEETVQAARIGDGRSIDPRASFEAGADIESQIQAQKGSGSSLPAEVQADMGSRFGADFGQVRVHTDSQAAQLNRELSAQAFTHGADIYMGEGKFDPGSSAGKHLLAHELTHTIQQGASPVGSMQRRFARSGQTAHSDQLVMTKLGKSVDGEEELKKSADSSILTKTVEGDEELMKGAPSGQEESVHGAGCGCALCKASVQRMEKSETNIERDVDVSVVEHSTNKATPDTNLAMSDLLAKPSVSVRAGAAPSLGLGGDYGLTYPENVKATISAKKVGTAWFPVVKGLRGNYSMQAGLLSGQSEITGPGGNTTQVNYLDQIKNLKMIGEDVGNPWYMKKAVVNHEKVHAKRFKPGLKNAATSITASLEAISIADTGQKKKEAIKGLEADGTFQAELANATATWLAEILTLVAGDHTAGGPTETAERKVVDPMRKKICKYAEKKKWPASPYC